MLDVKTMPRVPGIAVPAELYVVADEPALLGGMALPRPTTPWAALHAAGFRNVLSLEPARFDPAPLARLETVPLQDLHGGRHPKTPDDERASVLRAARLVHEAITRGEGTVVHCVGGTGRTGTVLGCVLRLMGHPAEDAIAYLARVNQARGGRTWPEAPWQAETVRGCPPA